jgi:cytidylate kinase
LQIESDIRMITISREYGSGGRRLASRLSRLLGWPLVDRLLVEEVARRVGLEANEVQAVDEHVGSLLERLSSVFSRGNPDWGIVASYPEPDFIAQVERAIMVEVAEGPPVIIVGHGGQCLFRNRPDAMHVRVVAPVQSRVGEVAARRQISLEHARAEVHRIDQERERYIRHHFHERWNDPALYDVTLNTSALSLEEAGSLLLEIVTRRQAATPRTSPPEAHREP